MTTKFSWCFPTDHEHENCIREFPSRNTPGKIIRCACPKHDHSTNEVETKPTRKKAAVKKTPATHPEEFPHFRDGAHDDSIPVSEGGGPQIIEVPIPKKGRRRTTSR